MPFDATPQTKTEPDVLNLDGLIVWLETQPPERDYDFLDCTGKCLWGQYAAAQGVAWRDAKYWSVAPAIGEVCCGAQTLSNFYLFGAAAVGYTFGAALQRGKLLRGSSMSRPITLRHGPLGRSRRRSRRASRLFLAAIVAGLWLALYASAFR